ncbi:twin-arginine translocation signal domain-containing protein [Geomonas terrae]|uniref:Nitrate reductase n=1 Tax=Geomonas terrae TaxID=2562681 RepID=A0A4S1CLW1_9BACT|nr:molybdopterin-dependent oxidoreductase [Geomonas terrae]TGU74788.1 twin-arginine translocation signal domain-containing protein [Geomonas terrae]
MGLSRRDFIKACAAAAAFAAAGASVARPEWAEAAEDGITWGKAPCRYCGVGCSVLVGVKGGRIVSTKGDPAGPVNKGLNCIKGYFLSKALYGKDRLTTPLIRKGNRMVEASWDEALDLIAAQYKKAIAEHGPDSVALYGSGQWTIQEGYVASKLMKGGIGTNNLEPNARLCMASAVVAFMNTFGSDEPMGCYDDLDLGDTYVLWGANMAEAHPVLFSRLIDNKLKHPKVKLIDIATRRTRTTKMADEFIAIKPHGDLAALNAIIHVILRDKLYDEAFVAKHVSFKRGKENAPYGLKDKEAFNETPADVKNLSFEEYKALMKPYTPQWAQKVSGIPAAKIEELARVYGDKSRKVNSLWTMGVNQHSRGVWVNNLIYNLHLLTGKICKPGENPLSLTGQPSACGTAREVGTFAHRLPADMVVMNEAHRKKAAGIWGVPAEKIPAKVGLHTVEMFRAIDRGELKCIWIQCTNPFQSLPNLNRVRKAAQSRKAFIVVSDIYPTRSTELADVVLPSASWVEKEGVFGNTERRTQQWFKMVNAPGKSKEDVWQLIEFAKRMGHGALFPYPEKGMHRAIFEEYRKFTLGTGKDLAPYGTYAKVRGLRWPVKANGTETRWRYTEADDEHVAKGEGIKFYKAPNNKVSAWFRPYEPPAEVPDRNYPFWFCTGRLLEHWHTGTMTGRVPELRRAVSQATVELHPEDAKRLGIRNRDQVRITSRRGSIVLTAEIGGRGTPERGSVFTTFFDEKKLVNEICIDAFDPLSKEPDFKKCAVKVQKA